MMSLPLFRWIFFPLLKKIIRDRLNSYLFLTYVNNLTLVGHSNCCLFQYFTSGDLKKPKCYGIEIGSQPDVERQDLSPHQHIHRLYLPFTSFTSRCNMFYLHKSVLLNRCNIF